jgi:phosphoribosylamine-glycine ligase
VGITALGDTIREAINSAYSVTQGISWGRNDYHYRKDIAMKYAHLSKQAHFFP